MGIVFGSARPPQPETAVTTAANIHNAVTSVETVEAELKRNPHRLNEKTTIVLTQGQGKHPTFYLHGVTPLLAACVYKKWDVATFLINNGADINVADEDGYTPLMRASKDEAIAIVTLLLAQPNIDVDATSNEDDTAIIIAASRGHFDTALLLAGSGASVDKKNNVGRNALSWVSLSQREELQTAVAEFGCCLK